MCESLNGRFALPSVVNPATSVGEVWIVIPCVAESSSMSHVAVLSIPNRVIGTACGSVMVIVGDPALSVNQLVAGLWSIAALTPQPKPT